ncbi:hypothetical protein BABINDRAFT_165277 [Babjeviella inositovora NRRL Y-12698]|uniref:DH domain-containing protein n=1 Tax=Babjeviella inositovora NRRL Y-12698 TaxID=984486 RepID=A0A1E3QVZ3_9ASCO|nr:uncharacterized protein BABINDRAFT_165277 [Babjeviella inositovora NRRL Y-12698]ODQ81754.1 hypothetical protein BABINDRAFT_165277 [Babjeviella inositovora NRRL Y-12698]
MNLLISPTQIQCSLTDPLSSPTHLVLSGNATSYPAEFDETESILNESVTLSSLLSSNPFKLCQDFFSALQFDSSDILKPPTVSFKDVEQSPGSNLNKFQLLMDKSPLSVVSLAPCDGLSSMNSPILSVSYSPEINANYKQNLLRRKLLEELINSEESYVSSLKLLVTVYLQPALDSRRPATGIPIIALFEVSTLLLSVHQTLLLQLHRLFRVKYREASTNSETIASVFSSTITAAAADLVANIGVSPFLYIAYCAIYEEVLQLIHHASINSSVEKVNWLQGCRKFLETSQPSDNHLDLSFVSLAQKPISRISKYRLVLETLLKHTSLTDASAYQQTENALDILINKLQIINDLPGNLIVVECTQQLSSLLYFPSTKSVPLEFFGKVLLTGALNCCWVDRNKKVRSEYMCCFLFKSHFILADAAKNSTKANVKFVISLSASKIILQGTEDLCFSEGLNTRYAHCFKLFFEKQFSVFEILMIAMNEQELVIWQEKLDLLINFVNGPYQWDYSASDMEYDLASEIPSTICALDVCVSKSRELSSLSSCYFSEVIPLRILHFVETQTAGEEGNPKLRDRNRCTEICVKKLQRLHSQTRLGPLWSHELPLLPERSRSFHGTIRSLRLHTLITTPESSIDPTLDLMEVEHSRGRVTRVCSGSLIFHVSEKHPDSHDGDPSMIRRASSTITSLFRSRSKPSYQG